MKWLTIHTTKYFLLVHLLRFSKGIKFSSASAPKGGRASVEFYSLKRYRLGEQGERIEIVNDTDPVRTYN